jgi:hypothetical protein
MGSTEGVGDRSGRQTATPARAAAQRPGGVQVTLSLTALAAAWLLLALRVDPVPTWFYVAAWYPTLVLLDGIVVHLDQRSLFASQRPLAFSLFAWSPIVWLIFEAANFRLENWYYVNLPANAAARWAGIVLSFATVLPAIVLAERALAAIGLFARERGPRVTIRPWELLASGGFGIAAAALLLMWPRQFFPLVWGSGLLLAEPFVYRRAPRLSLFRDLERGDWGRAGRLLIGGLGIGFLWELYNHVAESSWIYTVPGLETWKLFEMPPLGFLGFPVFALEAWAIYAVLCALGVAVPAVGDARIVRGRTWGVGVLAAGSALAVLVGMERRTISSTVPALGDLPNLRAVEVQAITTLGIRTTRDLANARPEDLEQRGLMEVDRARAAVETARLVTLRGIGAEHARALRGLGVLHVCDLAERDAATLADLMRRNRAGHRPTAAEVRVWIRAAEGACRTSPG